MSDNRAVVAQALSAYGAAWRGDWSDFDGRGLRNDLDDTVIPCLADDAPEVTYEQLCVMLGVCPVARAWPEYCDEKTERGYSCAHMVAPPASEGTP